MEAPHNEESQNQAYFCYQCNKEVAVEGTQGGMKCAECEGGFLEAIATVNPEFRRPTRRHSRRRRNSSANDSNTLSLSDALEHMYPHQMLQMVQMILESARTGNHRHPPQEDPHEEARTTPEEGEVVNHEHMENSDDESETGGLRLELESFDLNENDDDDDEWEEAEEDEDGVVHPHEGTNSHEQEHEERARRARSNLTVYMRELFQSLMDQNVEVRVELPDVYLSNPGDYLDSRGFEQLLHQLAENDNSRRGAPPAAKSAVEKLEMVKIRQEHIDTGISVCAICKEQMLLDEPAKQLPCFHLYHQECILPWLGSRNSCPVCRYELPTDDPDYEEQKKNRRGHESVSATPNPASTTQEVNGPSDCGQNSGGSSTSASEACRDSEEYVGQSSMESSDMNWNRGVYGSGDDFDIGSLCTDHSGDSSLDMASVSITDEDTHSGITGNAISDTDITSSDIDVPHSGITGDGSSDLQESSPDVDMPNVGISGEDNRSKSVGTGSHTLRSWLLLVAGPVLSVMGLMFMNHLVGKQQVNGLEALGSAQRHWWSFN